MIPVNKQQITNSRCIDMLPIALQITTHDRTDMSCLVKTYGLMPLSLTSISVKIFHVFSIDYKNDIYTSIYIYTFVYF
jgi:hypothetical protein